MAKREYKVRLYCPTRLKATVNYRKTMTFKALKKGFSLEITQAQSRLFERLRLKPFWIWDTVEHKKADIETRGDCCLNYIIGLPTKDGQAKPLFDYQILLYESLFTRDSQKSIKTRIQT
jgi:hypothetical protein